MNDNRRERGQVLVLIILAIVAIMGMLALAVDGGRIYMERRRAQAAADAGAYTAAFSMLMGDTEAEWRAAAMEQMVLNGYNDTDSADTGQAIDVMIYYPPLDGLAHPERYENRPQEFVQVIIRTKTDPVFSQFVYNGPISMTVEAVVQATTYKSAYPGRALVTTGATSCGAVSWIGNQNLKLYNGSIYSHSKACDGNCNSIDHVGSGKIYVTNGNISTPGCINHSSQPNSMLATGGIDAETEPLAVPPYPVPDCNLWPDDQPVPERTYSGGSATLDPGHYASGIQVTGNKTDIVLNPGMYCIDGGLSMNGGRITGEGVILVIKTGGVDIGGNTIVHLTAPKKLVDNSEQNWGGMLIFMYDDNDSVLSVNGGGNSNYTGTIYAAAPANPATKTKCNVLGNSATMAYNTSFICYSIKLGGTTDVNIYYQEKQNYRPPPSLNLNR